MASKLGPHFWQHRVTVTMWNSEKQVEEIIYMFYPTADEAGMMVYILVHTLDQRKFSAVQETRRGNKGYAVISKGDWNKIEYTEDKFAELKDKRLTKSETRTKVTVKRMNDPSNTFEFCLYFRTISETDIATTLLNTGLRAVKTMIVNERRRAKDNEWAPFRTASFVSNELAELWSRLSKENQSTAMEYLTQLYETTQG